MKINCKLTDFGSSRNINMLMTNLTFTKGIGTPKYLAPEILNKDKYKKPADIYSLSMTMLEIMIWDDAFPKSQFKFPWKIVEMISSGKRPATLEYVTNEDMKKMIDSMWCQSPKHRMLINDVVLFLKAILIKINYPIQN